MRTFDLDAFDAFDPWERPGDQILPWEMWERDRPWREDAPSATPDLSPHATADPAPTPRRVVE